MVACEEGHTDIVTLLLGAPGLDINVVDVSCVSGKRLHAVISHCHVPCKPEVWQEGWVLGRVSVEAEYVGGGL